MDYYAAWCRNTVPTCGIGGLQQQFTASRIGGHSPPAVELFSVDIYSQFNKHGRVQYEIDRKKMTAEQIEALLLELLSAYGPHRYRALFAHQVIQRTFHHMPMHVIFYTGDYSAMFTLTKQWRLNQVRTASHF